MKRLFILITSIIAAALFLYYQNNYIGVSSIELKLQRLPRSFNGLRVVHLSDLHSKLFGENQDALVSKVSDAKPDIIFLTGDMVDSKIYIVGIDAPAFNNRLYYDEGKTASEWAAGF